YNGGFKEATNVSTGFAELGWLFGASSARLLKPYLRAGAGVLVQRYDPGALPVRPNTVKTAGASGGAGVRVGSGAEAGFLEAHFISGAHAGFLALTGGLTFQGKRGEEPEPAP